MRRLLRKARMLGRLTWRGWMHDQSRYDAPSQVGARERNGAPPRQTLTNFLSPPSNMYEREFMQVTAFATAVSASPFTVRTQFSDGLRMMAPDQQNSLLAHAYERAAYQVQLEAMREQQRQQAEAVMRMQIPSAHGLLTDGMPPKDMF